AEYREYFGYGKHRFTGVDYVEYYRSIVEQTGTPCEIIFSNQPRTILDYTRHVLTCDVHSRARTKRILEAGGAETLYNLEDILRESVDGSGYNEIYGLLGSNKATEDTVKLFPR